MNALFRSALLTGARSMSMRFAAIQPISCTPECREIGPPHLIRPAGKSLGRSVGGPCLGPSGQGRAKAGRAAPQGISSVSKNFDATTTT
jgi:hypothetical protein